jgi:hypothetical protein
LPPNETANKSRARDQINETKDKDEGKSSQEKSAGEGCWTVLGIAILVAALFGLGYLIFAMSKLAIGGFRWLVELVVGFFSLHT